jgi:hypothetical protein
MDWWGRFLGARKLLSVAAAAPFLGGERLWAIVVLGVTLILAVCWLACRFKDDDIETPLITLRRGKWKGRGPEAKEKDSEEPEEKDDAKAS